MKKLLLTLTLLLTLGFAASAETVAFVAQGATCNETTDQVVTSSQTSLTAEGVCTVEIGGAYNSGDKGFRWHSKKTLEITPAVGVTITGIVWTNTHSTNPTYTVNNGSVSTINKVSTWSGQSTSAISITQTDQVRFKYLIVTYSAGTPACDVPTFSVNDNAELFAGQTVLVNKGNADSCELLVNNEPQSGLEYTIPETAEIGSTITLTANSTLEGGEPNEATATISVRVVAKPVYTMFDFENEATTTYSTWPSGAVTSTSQNLSHTIDGVLLNATGRLTIFNGTAASGISNGWALRLYAANASVPSGKVTITAPEGYYITSIEFNADKFSNYTNVANDQTVVSKDFTATATTIVKSIKVYVAAIPVPEPSLVEESTDINITHGKVAGVLTIAYSFEIANHSGNEVVVTATINGKEHITFTKVETPTAAPAREAAENGNWMERGTLTAKHEDLKGAPSLSVNVKATLDGKELYNVDHTNYTTTGIEDVTVEGNEAAEYFNLQGIRVAEPQAGQVYIVRRGAKTTKELVK